MICNTTCMKCPLPQLFKVNFSRHHGICKNHNIERSTIQKCNNCNSIVPVIFINTNLCVLCDSILGSTHSTLQICRNCLKQSETIQSYPIYSKKTVCDLCLDISEGIVLFCKCNHLVCTQCLDNKNTCRLCDSFDTGVQEVIKKKAVIQAEKPKEPDPYEFKSKHSAKSVPKEEFLSEGIDGITEIIDENSFSESRSLPKQKPLSKPTVIKYNTIKTPQKNKKPVLEEHKNTEEIKSAFSESLKNSSRNLYSQQHSESATTDRELIMENNKLRSNRAEHLNAKKINSNHNQRNLQSREAKYSEKDLPDQSYQDNSQNILINNENNGKSKLASFFFYCIRCFKSA